MFGIDLWDASLLPAMLVAILGGLISFASPCVLPIVPPYLAYMGGVSMDEMNSTAHARRRAVVASLFFVLGLSTVFILLGFTASSLGRLFLSNQDWFVIGAGVMVMIFGAHFLGVIRIGILDSEARMEWWGPGWISLWGLCVGVGLCFWLDALFGANFGGHPRFGCRYGKPGQRRYFTSQLCGRPGHSFCFGGRFFPLAQGSYGLDEAAYAAH